MNFVRSLIFNILLFGLSAIMCIVMLPALMVPRKIFMGLVHAWVRSIAIAEKYVAGISTKVIGIENIPDGPCIIAPKHQSAWETFKLHVIFDDSAIVLKKELLRFPLWGWFLWKSGVIPIDRQGRAAAINRMMSAAHKAVADGRKIVIFPQGTRVPVGADRPYKSGIAALYKELQLPIVPMALNSGLLWPKKSFMKKPGTITIEFLRPIPPGLSRADMMDKLKTQLEAASDKLAKKELAKKP